MGMLSVKGQIEVAQFWPDGTSDADTAHVIVDGGAAFKYQAQPGGATKATPVFKNATVKGKVSKPALKNNKLIVRFQGIDATELHFRPAPLGKQGTPAQKARYKPFNKEYRQYFGETATAALGAFLAKAANGKKTIRCVLTTAVNRPTDVFDTYGRFIGDINVQIGNKNINVNRWLVEQGWAFPSFYTTMTQDEIKSILSAWNSGRRVAGRLGRFYTDRIVPFKPGMVLRRNGALQPSKDKGPGNMPKLFRRQTTWWAQNQAGFFKKNFAQYLATGKDEFLMTKEFLQVGVHSALSHKLGDYLKGGTFTLAPWEMVFKELPSKLVNPKGQEILTW